jgi:uncharacterized membrane-anchored protein
MKYRAIISTIILAFSTMVLANNNEELTPEQQEYVVWAKGILESLDKQTGEIKLPGAIATLNVPDEFYYLNSEDTKTVLVDIWGNMPGAKTLGMLFPADMTPFDRDAWAVTIEYEEDGYISDEDANDIDYADLLRNMKKEVQAQSRERVKQGYESIELIGWAASPFYQPDTHKLYWAKEIKFGENEINTLNYNIRVLGRKGVLVLNFIAGMDKMEVVESKLETVLKLAEFDQGARYADFNPSVDKVAAYGLGALVAGKVIAKTGFLTVALAFLKKFGVFIVIGIGAFLKKIFSNKSV